ncbi:MAG: TRAP transporter substrate-binding protein DctP [Kiritimatiellae bacterium]|nr:TRAP transporter substrate-binding protein DctP [Kiritimatiellia bacterium]
MKDIVRLGLGAVRSRHALLAAGLLAAIVSAPPPAAGRPQRAKYRFKIATLAPDGSPWMQTFKKASDEVAEATEGEVRLKAYPGGVLGEEKDVLIKIQLGQVDGGGFLGFGVGRICPESRALMQPMLFEDYGEVDFVFEKMRLYLEAEALKNGFVALGWTEIGFSYLYSTIPVGGLQDLRGAKPWMIAEDMTMQELFRAGDVSGIPIPVVDVLPALQTGLIKSVFSPPYAAVAMQWFTRVKYRNAVRLTYSFGGLFVAEKSWSRLPEPYRATASAITHRHMAQLTQQVRRSNAEALEVMAANGITLVTPAEAELGELRAVARKALSALQGKVFSTETYNSVTEHLDTFRRRK